MPFRRRAVVWIASSLAAAFAWSMAALPAEEPSPAVPPKSAAPASPQGLKPQENLAADDLRQAAEWEKEIAAAYLANRPADALAAAEKLAALYREKLGADHWRAAGPRYLVDFLRRAKGWSAETFAKCEAARKKNEAAAVLESGGDFGAATALRQAYLDQVRAVAADLPEAATAAGQLANNLYALGRHAESEALLREALALRRKLYGDAHPETAAACNNLAVALNSQGKLAEGEPLLREALEVRVRLFGDGAETATNYANLAACLSMQGKGIAAEALQRKALALREKAYGPDAIEIANDLNNLAGRLNDRAAYAEAETLYRRALSIRQKAFGERHPDTVLSRNNLGLNQLRQGKTVAAVEYFRWARADLRVEEGTELLTALLENNLGAALSAEGTFDEAEQCLKRALEIRRRRLGAEHRDTLVTMNNLADCQAANAAKAAPADAEKLHRTVLAIRERVLGPDHLDVAASCNNLAAAMERQGRVAEGEPLHRRALAIFRRVHGDDHPDVFSQQVNLACTLDAVGKSAEAVELCEKAAAGYEAARQQAAGSGLDRVAFGVERSPYRLLAFLRRRAGDPAGAWDALESDLARGVLEEAARRRGSTLTDAEAAESKRLRAELDAIQDRLPALSSLRVSTPQEKTEEEGLVERRKELETQLHRIAVAGARRETASLAEIQAALPDDAALIAWLDWSGGTFDAPEHWGVALRSKGPPTWVKLPGAGPDQAWTDQDSAAAFKLAHLLQKSRYDWPGEHGRQKWMQETTSTIIHLRCQRLTPLETHDQKPLEGVKRLYVVGVNRMAGVPLELLTDEYVVSYVPSGTFLARVRNRPRPVGPAELLAVGDPVFHVLKKRGEEVPRISPPEGVPQGIVVAKVEAGGRGSVAGVKVGDRLVSYNDATIASEAQLHAAQSAELVRRGGGLRDVALRVLRNTSDGPKTLSLSAAGGELGIEFEPPPGTGPLREAPVFPADYPAALAKGDDQAGWPELPGTAVELSRLKSLFGAELASVLQGRDASAGRLEDLRVAKGLTRFRYLHFATHGEADEVRPFGSRLILAVEPEAPTAPPERAEAKTTTPVSRGRRRSGAGSDAAGELTAGDVLDGWKLDADLVTLSACESGLGSQGGGEGMLGFAQAFLLAGGRSVCLSLWKVDDAATSLLMDRFYQNLLGRRPELAATGPLSKAEALFEAKQWLRNLPMAEARKLTVDLGRGASRGKGQTALPVVDFKHGTSALRELRTMKLADGREIPLELPIEKPFDHPKYWAAFVLVGEP